MKRPTHSRTTLFVLALCLVSSCARRPAPEAGEQAGTPAASETQPPMQVGALPAGGADAMARLAASPRHAEWVMVRQLTAARRHAGERAGRVVLSRAQGQ